MQNIFDQIPKERVDAIREQYRNQVPLKEIEHQFGLKKWQLAALTKVFRKETDATRRRPRKSHDIERIVLPTRRLAKDGGGWQYGSITLPRNSMHVQALRERGYAEI